MTDDETPNQFLTWINDDTRSPWPDQIDLEFRNLVEAVQAIGRKGSMTIKIDMVPGPAVPSPSVEATMTVTSKPPVEPPTPRFYFATEDGGLARNPPQQGGLFDRGDVEGDRG